jgi:hypothetical protein
MSKAELREFAAMLVNLVNDVDKDEWTPRQMGDLHTALAMLPELVRDDWRNNATIQAKQL